MEYQQDTGAIILPRLTGSKIQGMKRRFSRWTRSESLMYSSVLSVKSWTVAIRATSVARVAGQYI